LPAKNTWNPAFGGSRQEVLHFLIRFPGFSNKWNLPPRADTPQNCSKITCVATESTPLLAMRE
jgi:hypothetical protein